MVSLLNILFMFKKITILYMGKNIDLLSPLLVNYLQ